MTFTRRLDKLSKVEESKIVLENALRWTNNILAEVLSNHAHRFPEVANNLREAVRLIEDSKWKIRKSGELCLSIKPANHCTITKEIA